MYCAEKTSASGRSVASHRTIAANRGARSGKGFTLIEVLVIIAIVGVLIALLLPAVQAARESARAVKCQNHLREIAIACMRHVEVHQHFPTGGWGYSWHGDPDRGFGKDQPGSWCYNLLPFIEQQPLRSRGSNLNDVQKRSDLRAVAGTALPLLYCPSRRKAMAYPYPGPDLFRNIDRPDELARTDYAANIGDAYPVKFGAGPTSLKDADSGVFQWKPLDRNGKPVLHNGVVFCRSEIRIADVTDGTSHTYLVGEKYLDQRHYTDGRGRNDDQGAFMGYDRDTLRTTHSDFLPQRDKADIEGGQSFGSAHPTCLHMALCDGSVRRVAYNIPADLHGYSGRRDDGVPAQLQP